MMKSIIVMTMIVSLAGFTFAFQAMDKVVEVQGEIVEVSTEESTITLEEVAKPADEPSPDAMQSGVVRTFVVNEATKLTSEGEPIELADIHAGARAAVRYVIEAGDNIAMSIELQDQATE